MELAGSGYFFALAALSMAFAGFTSIVVVLHQGTGKPLSPLQVLISSLFAELGLMAAAFAMLAPTLAICGIREILVWQISSVIMLVVLLPWLIMYPVRRRAAASDQRLPLRWYIMTALGAVAVIGLFLNMFPTPLTPSPAPLAIATVYVLSYASVAFVRTYALFLRE